MNYEPIIGLEVHVELKTNSKMFCGCSADYFGKEPNTHTCPVCLGLPGALPVPNKKAIDWCIMIGLALNCEIPLVSKFDRKNYFYPDLPKGYQISQYDKPFAIKGTIKVKSEEEKIIRIRRVHMEEDTGKLLHEGQTTLIDFNRSGVPLVEIVTEPDIHTALGAKEYLQKLQRIIRHLGVSDCDMEKGTMRLEPNISLRVISSLRGAQATKQSPEDNGIATLSSVARNDKSLPNYKVEVKNINSFKFVEKAINYEIERQRRMLDNGERIVQETRGWNESRQVTVSQRSKEEAHDYRYFPEPDIPPIVWKKEDIEAIKKVMPESYDDLVRRFTANYQLPPQYVEMALDHPETTSYVEKAIAEGKKVAPVITPKVVADYLFNKKIDKTKVSPFQLIQQIQKLKSKPLTDTIQLQTIIANVIRQNTKIVADYKAGKTAIVNVLIGLVMKETRGQADAQGIKKLLIEGLNM